MSKRDTFRWKVVATLAAILAGGCAVGVVQVIDSYFYGPPAGLDLTDKGQLAEFVKTLPLPAFLLVVASWICGGYLAALVGRLLAPGRGLLPSLIACTFLLLATVFNLLSIPHPTWMWFAAFLAYPLFGGLGCLCAAPRNIAFQTARHIEAPIAKVFQTLAQVEHFSQAVPGITNVEFLTEQKYGVGTRFRETRMMNGKAAATDLEVTELSENESVRMVSLAGGATWDTLFTVRATSDGTHMEMNMTASAYQFAAQLMLPVIMPIVSKAIESDMDAVKQYCEREK